MSKINEMINDLSELDRDGLETLVFEASKRLKDMRPVRIKAIYKRCGKSGCTCRNGDLADYGHGPYLYAVWSDGGKTKQKSLGREYHDRELEKMRQATLPSWYEKRFRVSEKRFKEMSGERKWRCYERSLSDAEFEAFYNITPSEDGVGRPRKLRYDKDRYDTAFSQAKDAHTVGFSEFGRYGIGTLKGVLVLRDMLARGFYLKD